MATRRVAKKKAAEPEAPVVTQVVEEVSDEKPAEVVEKIKEEAQKIEEAAEKLEDVLPEETPPPTPERAVVSELYKPESASIAPEIVAESSSSVRPLLVWSLVVIGIALLTGGTLLVAVKGFQGVSFMAKPTPTPAPTPTPTPASTVNRADIKVQVLNGGGVAGSGAKMKAFLEEKGYTVADVKNADAFSYETTQILVKAGKEAYLALLKKDLEEKYTIGTAAATLAPDSPSDAQVTVGKK
ncbi:LytR C-terminal domain-containing protein [Candidatus Gottesmanbacteria bacterium]|nr:LytR C-terminal domain-containing protein [Candidatus Gottesmanbacteria bacterium]